MRVALFLMALVLVLGTIACNSSQGSLDSDRSTVGSSTGSGPGTPANGGPNAMGRSGGGPNS